MKKKFSIFLGSAVVLIFSACSTFQNGDNTVMSHDGKNKVLCEIDNNLNTNTTFGNTLQRHFIYHVRAKNSEFLSDCWDRIKKDSPSWCTNYVKDKERVLVEVALSNHEPNSDNKVGKVLGNCEGNKFVMEQDFFVTDSE